MATKLAFTSSKNVRPTPNHEDTLSSVYIPNVGNLILPNDSMGGYLDNGKAADGTDKPPAVCFNIGEGQGPFKISRGKDTKPTWMNATQLVDTINSHSGYSDEKLTQFNKDVVEGKIFAKPQFENNSAKQRMAPMQVGGSISGIDKKTGEPKTREVGSIGVWAATPAAAEKKVKQYRQFKSPNDFEGKVTVDLKGEKADILPYVPTPKEPAKEVKQEARIEAAPAPEVPAVEDSAELQV